MGILFASKIFDKLSGRLDHPIFERQVNTYEPLKIRSWFSGDGNSELGRVRTLTVLRMAMLSADARTTLTSMIAAFCGLLATIYFIATTASRPTLFELRLSVAFAFCGLLFLSGITLVVRLAIGQIRPVPVSEENISLRKRLSAGLRRSARLDHLTIYNVILFAANIVTIVEGIGT
jgi:hypothetical protein